MLRQSSSSSSSTSSSLSPQFDSGIQQSVSRFSGFTESKGTGLEIRYNDLKFGNLLGQGTYGKVYTGIYREIKVAIKVYDLHSVLPNEQQSEVLREAGLMARLPKSPYLIGFHGVSFDEKYCLVMEYAEGGTLQARLNKTSEQLTLPQQMRWAMQISYGLNQLHSLNILHRDLKSKNILLNSREEAKVGDFGLSIIKSTSVSQSKISSAMGTAGTLPWMAPELFNGKSNSKQTDIYSLGIVLWEIISREIPFKDKMAGVIVGMVLAGNRETLPEKCPELFKLMIAGCWNQDAKNRPDAQQVGYQFETALRSLDGLSPSLSLSSSGSDLKHVRSSIKNLDISKRLDSIYGRGEKEIMPNLPEMSFSSQTMIPAPKPPIQEVDIKDLKQLLQCVVEGEQDKAETLIQKDKNLLLHMGRVTDLSGREFKQITAFQYAFWAMDWHMWKMIQKHLSKEVQAEQLSIWESKEDKDLPQGKHFSLQPLIDALQTYVDKVPEQWNYSGYAGTHWCKAIGGSQKMLPLHFVNEYVRPDRSFYPCPIEWASQLPRTQELKVRDTQSKSKYVKGTWFTAPSSLDGLGVTYACLRYNFTFAIHREGRPGSIVPPWEAKADLIALQSLWKTRTQQMELLKSNLLVGGGHSKEPSKLLFDSQRLMPAPRPTGKSMDIKEVQLLQSQLIAACKQGDEETITALLKQGAKPNITDAKGEHPLGAAVWGMSPVVVYTLLREADGIAPITWSECEKHNLTHYREVFAVSKLTPKTFEEWHKVLSKITPNKFLRTYHTRVIQNDWFDHNSPTWNEILAWVKKKSARKLDKPGKEFEDQPELNWRDTVEIIEDELLLYRTQIRQGIETAIRSTMINSFS